MFQYCVWYTLHQQHSLSKMVHRLSNIFGSESFSAHITIVSNRLFKEADDIYKYQCMVAKPWFHVSGTIYQTKTEIGTNTFYALQQDYLMYDLPKLGKYHVSLCYQLNKPFTATQIKYVRDILPIDTIWSNDFNVTLNDCRLSLPRNWYEIKRNIL